MSRTCGYIPEKIAGQRAPVKAEMDGFAPGLDRRPPSAEWVDKAANSLKVLGRCPLDFEVVLLSKFEWAGKPF